MNLEEYRKKHQDNENYQVAYNENTKTWDIYYSDQGELLAVYLPGYLTELEAFEDLNEIVDNYEEKIRQSELNPQNDYTYPQIPIDPETKAILEAEELEAQKDPNWLPY